MSQSTTNTQADQSIKALFTRTNILTMSYESVGEFERYEALVRRLGCLVSFGVLTMNEAVNKVRAQG